MTSRRWNQEPCRQVPLLRPRGRGQGEGETINASRRDTFSPSAWETPPFIGSSTAKGFPENARSQRRVLGTVALSLKKGEGTQFRYHRRCEGDVSRNRKVRVRDIHKSIALHHLALRLPPRPVVQTGTETVSSDETVGTSKQRVASEVWPEKNVTRGCGPTTPRAHVEPGLAAPHNVDLQTLSGFFSGPSCRGIRNGAVPQRQSIPKDQTHPRPNYPECNEADR